VTGEDHAELVDDDRAQKSDLEDQARDRVDLVDRMLLRVARILRQALERPVLEAWPARVRCSAGGP
jgi:hypothetical protein